MARGPPCASALISGWVLPFADFENDAQKQSELRRAIVNSLNLEDDEFGEDNVEIKVVKKERRRRKEVTVEVRHQGPAWGWGGQAGSSKPGGCPGNSSAISGLNRSACHPSAVMHSPL